MLKYVHFRNSFCLLFFQAMCSCLWVVGQKTDSWFCVHSFLFWYFFVFFVFCLFDFHFFWGCGKHEMVLIWRWVGSGRRYGKGKNKIEIRHMEKCFKGISLMQFRLNLHPFHLHHCILTNAESMLKASITCYCCSQHQLYKLNLWALRREFTIFS